jgi:hypothetical protein
VPKVNKFCLNVFPPIKEVLASIVDEQYKFYVYGHYKPGSDIPFNIGKGSGRRATRSSGRNEHWGNIVNKYGFIAEIMYYGLTNEQSLDIEKMLIAKYGRSDINCGPLVNHNDGGFGYPIGHTPWNKGLSGVYKPIPETIEKQRQSMLGKNTGKHSPEIIAKQIASHQGQIPHNKGTTLSKEWVENLRISHMGIKPTEESNEKRRKHFKNTIWIVNDELKTNKIIIKTEQIPSGWRRGRAPR